MFLVFAVLVSGADDEVVETHSDGVVDAYGCGTVRDLQIAKGVVHARDATVAVAVAIVDAIVPCAVHMEAVFKLIDALSQAQNK